ncbi:MAG: hypothetical protein BA864_14395 [Desulfuromonadales bacterium C00003093]|nr:MAG: hypothetical protein BA864_14395 [Desulfuromonadales bacterium C00003093]
MRLRPILDNAAMLLGVLGIGKASLMVAGGSPFTPSWLQSVGGLCGVIIVMLVVIIHNQMAIKDILRREDEVSKG